MGLFDNIGQSRQTGQPTFVQEAVAFGKVDLNTIFKWGTVAAVTWISDAISYFRDVFGHKDCNAQDAVLYERMRDQIPGMIIVLVKLGLEDHTMLDAYNDDPNRADYGGRPQGAFPCNDGINPARALFTTLFGVRIINSNYLDALDHDIDTYFNVDGGAQTIDIPREAVARAVRLKQQFFPISTYNSRLWDMNQFQANPLVAPIPDFRQVGKLYTGTIFGVDVVNGLVQGSPIPNLPTSTNTPFIETDPWHDIIYPKGNPGSTVTPSTVPTGTQSTLDKIISFVKTNPKGALSLGALAALAVNELSDDET